MARLKKSMKKLSSQSWKRFETPAREKEAAKELPQDLSMQWLPVEQNERANETPTESPEDGQGEQVSPEKVLRDETSQMPQSPIMPDAELFTSTSLVAPSPGFLNVSPVKGDFSIDPFPDDIFKDVIVLDKTDSQQSSEGSPVPVEPDCFFQGDPVGDFQISKALFDADHEESPIKSSHVVPFEGVSQEDRFRDSHNSESSKHSIGKKVLIKDEISVRLFYRSIGEQQDLFRGRRNNRRSLAGRRLRAKQRSVAYSEPIPMSAPDRSKMGTFWEQKMKLFESRIDSWSKQVQESLQANAEDVASLQLCTSPAADIDNPMRVPVEAKREMIADATKEQGSPPNDVSLDDISHKFNLCVCLADEILEEESEQETNLADVGTQVDEEKAQERSQDKEKDKSADEKKDVVSETKQVDPPPVNDSKKRHVVTKTKKWLSSNRAHTVGRTSSIFESLQQPILDDTFPQILDEEFGNPVTADASVPFAFPFLGMRPDAFDESPPPVAPVEQERQTEPESPTWDPSTAPFLEIRPDGNDESPDISQVKEFQHETESPTTVASVLEVRHSFNGKTELQSPTSYEAVYLKKRIPRRN